jgi:hypothetical protein
MMKSATLCYTHAKPWATGSTTEIHAQVDFADRVQADRRFGLTLVAYAPASVRVVRANFSKEQLRDFCVAILAHIDDYPTEKEA